jgi:Ca2+-dependent lipid-binding protein
MGKLSIVVTAGSNLLAADIGGFSDPYVNMECTFGSQRLKFKTKIIKKTINPTWNETFQVEITHSDLENASITFKLWDWDALTSDDPYLPSILTFIQTWICHIGQ